jgi:very-short-patch-repair endonuclease
MVVLAKSPNWTEDELQILREYYSKSTYDELLALLPERNHKGINLKATRLGLVKSDSTKKKIRQIFGENQRGENNPMANRTEEGHPRWRGGDKKVNCIECGKEYTVRPYKYDQILAGKRKPLCGANCVSINWRKEAVPETSIERRMREELERRGIEYVQEFILGNKFALDFFLPKYGIVIECDGRYWHEKPDVAMRDKSKNAYIKKCGYSLYRFWDDEINASISSCVNKVLEEIQEKEAI